MSKRVSGKFMEKLNYKEMTNEISLTLYDKYYSFDEIKDLIVFYKSPTGQKTLKTMKPLLNESMSMTQERLLPKLPGIIREIQEEEKLEIDRRINAKKPRPGKPPTE
jgi:hypothetical protein